MNIFRRDLKTVRYAFLALCVITATAGDGIQKITSILPFLITFRGTPEATAFAASVTQLFPFVRTHLVQGLSFPEGTGCIFTTGFAQRKSVPDSAVRYSWKLCDQQPGRNNY
jgi:hypothetical protein